MSYYFDYPKPQRPIVVWWQSLRGVATQAPIWVRASRHAAYFARSSCGWASANRSLLTKLALAGGGIAALCGSWLVLRKFLPKAWRAGSLQLTYGPFSALQIGESSRAGSYEQVTKKPTEQLEVFTLEEPAVFVGYCCRMSAGQKDYLVVPGHVLALAAAGGDEVVVKGPAGQKSLKVTGEIILETDLVALETTNQFLSSIGASVVKPGVIDGKTSVTIAGPKGKGTVAPMEASTMFGRLVYKGTTLPGYSGALYRVSKPVAMHLSGGTVNLAISLSYVQLLLNRVAKEVHEATEDYLQKLYVSKVKIRAHRSPNDYDDIFLDIGGRYVGVDASTFSKVFGDTAADNLTSDYGYVDYESSFQVRPGKSGASGKQDGEKSGPSNSDTTSIPGYSKLSQKQRRKFRKQCVDLASQMAEQSQN